MRSKKTLLALLAVFSVISVGCGGLGDSSQSSSQSPADTPKSSSREQEQARPSQGSSQNAENPAPAQAAAEQRPSDSSSQGSSQGTGDTPKSSSEVQGQADGAVGSPFKEEGGAVNNGAQGGVDEKDTPSVPDAEQKAAVPADAAAKEPQAGDLADTPTEEPQAGDLVDTPAAKEPQAVGTSGGLSGTYGCYPLSMGAQRPSSGVPGTPDQEMKTPELDGPPLRFIARPDGTWTDITFGPAKAVEGTYTATNGQAQFMSAQGTPLYNFTIEKGGVLLVDQNMGQSCKNGPT